MVNNDTQVGAKNSSHDNNSDPNTVDISSLTTTEIKQFLHDLHVHQIELEQQNEELRTTQQALIQSRNRYRTLYQNAPVAYVTLNDSGMIVRLNQTTEQLLGASHQKISGQKLSQFIDPTMQENYYLFWKRLNETENSSTLTLKTCLRRADNAQVHIQIEGYKEVNVGSEQGHPQYNLAMVNVSELQYAHDVTQANLDYLSAIIHTIHEGLLVLDENLKVTASSRGFHDAFGINPEETIGRYIYDLGDGAWNIPELRTLLEKVIPKAQDIEQFELSHDFPAIGEVRMLLNAHQFHSEVEGEKRILIALHDISELTTVREEYKRSKERLDLALKGAQVALFNHDTDLRYSWIHNTLDEYTENEVIGKLDSEIMENQDEARHLEHIKRQVLETGVSSQTIVPLHVGGDIHYFNLTLEPLKNENDSIIGITCAALDITEQIIAQKREHMLQELTSAFSQATTTEKVAQVFAEEKKKLDAHLVAVAIPSSTDDNTLEIINRDRIPQSVSKKFPQISLDTKLPITDVYRITEPIWLHTRQEIKENYPIVAEHALPETGTQAIAALPMKVNDKIIGAITISYQSEREFTDDYQEFLIAIATQCAFAINRIQLQEQNRELMVMQERRWLANELHDAISQSLFTAQLISESLPKLIDGNKETLEQRFQDLHKVVRSAQAEMRVLLYELRPEQLEHGRFEEQLRHLAGRSGVANKTTLTINMPEDFNMPSQVKTEMYRIVQEALNNIIKHANCKFITIQLNANDDQIALEISDDGDGFDINQQSSGFGLQSMQERAKKINARLVIISVADKGTNIKVEWKKTANT